MALASTYTLPLDAAVLGKLFRRTELAQQENIVLRHFHFLKQSLLHDFRCVNKEKQPSAVSMMSLQTRYGYGVCRVRNGRLPHRRCNLATLRRVDCNN